MALAPRLERALSSQFQPFPHVKTAAFLFVVLAAITAFPSMSLSQDAKGKVEGKFVDRTGKTLQEFVIPDLKMATKSELAEIFPKNCPKPLLYTGDGRFYCAKGTGPHELKLKSDRHLDELIAKLQKEELINKK